MSTQDDQARTIAERVARRFGGDEKRQPKTDQVAANGDDSVPDRPRARMIDFISSGPPLRSAPSIVQASSKPRASESVPSEARAEFFQFVPVAQSPWLGRLPSMLGQDSPRFAVSNPQSASHSSEERFGVEEATVAELVEFFESEKKCAMDPSGKPCDHCAMCSSRGF
ncbi:MAG TPA: hypothetical protein VN696_07040 [Pyrinomonadaceae bacterium]|nr:hypothetical protein [Pyrinomonadaceae bacterium]